MRKRGLALLMAVCVTAGTVSAGTETNLVYAAEITSEPQNMEEAEADGNTETEVELETVGNTETEVELETVGNTEAEVELELETAGNIEAEPEELVDTENKAATLTEMPAGLIQAEAVGEILVDDETAEEETVENVLKGSAVYSNDWEKYGSYYFYNQMSADEKSYWDALNNVCLKYLTTQANATARTETAGTYYYIDGVFSAALSLSEIEEVYRIFRYSNPQYYFLKSAYYRMRNGRGAYGVAPCVYPAFATGTSRSNATVKVKSQVAAWQSQIDACATDADKVKLIHDLIIDKVEYNQTLFDSDFANEDSEYSQSAYSVFCTDLTVCAGYAQAFEMMCNGSGIDATAVTSAYHEWNKVRLNNSWYNVDCTWDDANGTVYYEYFERSDYYFDNVNYLSYVYHAEESIWDGYLPACTLDTGATTLAPGTLASVTETAAQPVITASISGSSYKIKLTSATSGASIYYTTDGSTPNQAYSKGTRYTGAFTVAAGKTVRAVAVRDGYADSSVAVKKLASTTKTYKITFNSNGGKGKMGSQSMVKSTSTAIKKNKFTRKYYTFAGWNTKANGKGKSYKNTQKIKLTKNITLYAQWKVTKYKITYQLNGGKNAKNPTSYTYQTSTVRLKNPTRKGYVFKGWYLDKKFKKRVTVIQKGSSGNKTLYAKWKKK